MILKKLANIDDPNSLAAKLRAKRFQLVEDFILKHYNGTPLEVLDVGGTIAYWKDKEVLLNGKVKVTCLNLYEDHSTEKNIRQIKGDALNMSEISDNQFFLVFSNSVIEHLYTLENQRKMANEIIRVSRYFYVQTPNKYFPLEPHFLFPLFQFLPRKVRINLLRRFDLGHVKRRRDYHSAADQIDEIRLLTKVEMKSLFNSKLYKERVLGFTKSIVAYNLA